VLQKVHDAIPQNNIFLSYGKWTAHVRRFFSVVTIGLVMALLICGLVEASSFLHDYLVAAGQQQGGLLELEVDKWEMNSISVASITVALLGFFFAMREFCNGYVRPLFIYLSILFVAGCLVWILTYGYVTSNGVYYRSLQTGFLEKRVALSSIERAHVCVDYTKDGKEQFKESFLVLVKSGTKRVTFSIPISNAVEGIYFLRKNKVYVNVSINEAVKENLDQASSVDKDIIEKLMGVSKGTL